MYNKIQETGDTMQQESMDTKSILATALMELTSRKNFAKITIADITHVSGFNRQTFYYHFRDKYELLSWIYEQEASQVFDEDISLENWHRYMAVLLQHIRSNKWFYSNTIRHDESYFQNFIFTLTSTLFYKAIDALDLHHQLDASDKKFYAKFFSFGISGVVINWIKSDMKESPEQVASALKSLAQDSEKLAYEKYRESYRKMKGTT